MLVEGWYDELAHQVQELLNCDAVGFWPGCSEPLLRHPLLRLLPVQNTQFGGWIGQVHQDVVRDERVRAFCDLAVQSGRIQRTSDLKLANGDFLIESYLAIPLERPAGMLGLFLAIDHRRDAFALELYPLLQRYCETTAIWFEERLARAIPHPDSSPVPANLSGPEQAMPDRGVTVFTELEAQISQQLQNASQEKPQLARCQCGSINEKQQVEAILAGIADGVIVMDVSLQPGRPLIISGWNRAAVMLTGIEIKEALGREMHTLLHWQDESGKQLEDLAYQVLSPRRIALGDGALQREFCAPRHPNLDEGKQKSATDNLALHDILHGPRPREDERWISIHASAITTTPGDAPPRRQVIFVLRDVSQQKELDRLKNEFLSMVSHELRTPLTAIKGYIGLLQGQSRKDEGLPPDAGQEVNPARQQQYLEIIMEQTSQLEVLISDLLDVSRIQSGRLTLRPASINITQLCQRIVQVIQGRERVQTKEKFHFRCTFAPDLPHIWADAQRVQQVITNLIENAVKYSPNGGLIEVIVSARRAFQGLKEPSEENENLSGKTRSPLMVHITVRDQGIGIARHQQTRLFKPFSRLEHPLTTEVPGTGLGLYITRRLVEAMGGGVILRSAEGRGTSITFTLPAIHPDEAASPLAFTSTISGDAKAATLEKINWPVPDNA